MKLTLIGSGVRAPTFVAAALRRAAILNLAEIWLIDIDERRLRLIGALCADLAREHGSRVRIELTTDVDAALRDADHVAIAIRPGGEGGRVVDEHIAQRHGVLGQETTGAGGFSMAMRSIPAVLKYAERLHRLNGRAWLYVFTNPAGLVTQALHDAGVERCVGICDSANVAVRTVARYVGRPAAGLRAEVFGLNHLSWTRRVMDGNVDRLVPLLLEPRFRAGTRQEMFDPQLVAIEQMWLNEYLHFYYYRGGYRGSDDKAGASRGEHIRAMTTSLLDLLELADRAGERGQAAAAFRAYHGDRKRSYMSGAYRPGAAAPRVAADEDEGYAGLMLDVVAALAGAGPMHAAVNVPNRGAIPRLMDADVVEVSCRITAGTITPQPVHDVPAGPSALIDAVKAYERQAVRAIDARSNDAAVEALMMHPLVGSFPIARALVSDFVTGHALAGWA